MEGRDQEKKIKKSNHPSTFCSPGIGLLLLSKVEILLCDGEEGEWKPVDFSIL